MIPFKIFICFGEFLIRLQKFWELEDVLDNKYGKRRWIESSARQS